MCLPGGGRGAIGPEEVLPNRSCRWAPCAQDQWQSMYAAPGPQSVGWPRSSVAAVRLAWKDGVSPPTAEVSLGPVELEALPEFLTVLQ